MLEQDFTIDNIDHNVVSNGRVALSVFSLVDSTESGAVEPDLCMLKKDFSF